MLKKNTTFFSIIIIALMNSQRHSIPLRIYSNINSIKDSTILFSENFSEISFSEWEMIDEFPDMKSNWYCENGYLVQDTDAGNKKNLLGSMAIYNKMDFTSYVLRTNVVHTDDDYIGVIFKYKDPANYYRFLLSSEDKLIRVDKKDKGKISVIEEIPNLNWTHCKFSITIFVKADSIKIFLNDQMFFSIVNDDNSPGKVGFVSIANLGSFFDDLTLYSDFKIFKENENLRIERGPYLQNVLGDSATIMWRTNYNSNSIVEYYSQHLNVNKVVNGSLTKLHEIKLNNLLHSMEYHYRVISDSVISDWYSFKTEGKSTREFSFIIYSDTQLNFLRHREIVGQMKKLDFDFILHCGDAVQRGPRDDWDTEFFNPLKEIISGKPIYCAIGNHELNDQNYSLNFSNPKSPNESFYSFKYLNCFFIFVDNPLAAYPDRNFYTDFKPGSIQYNWIETQLNSKTARESDWIFVISHVPIYVFGTTETYSYNNEYLLPLYNKYNVDFSFSGHVHGYERGENGNVNYIVTAGGGGAINKPSSKKIESASTFKVVYNFCHLTINNKAVSMKVIDNMGNMIDEFIFEKVTKK